MSGHSQLCRYSRVRNYWPYFTVALLLVACAHAAVGQEAGWTVPDPGLLRDANFDAMQRGERPVWGRSQHAGERSYRFVFNPGELQIDRIGPEPWGQVKQRVNAKPLAGQTLEFSAELSGTLSESGRRPIIPTGLSIRVLGYTAGMSPAIVGKSTLLIAGGEPELGPGQHDWTRQSVRFEIPEGATDIDVSIRLGMHGALSVRGPSLVVVGPTGGK